MIGAICFNKSLHNSHIRHLKINYLEYLFFVFSHHRDKNSSPPSSSFLFFSPIISAIGLSSSNSSQTTFNMAAKGKNKIIPASPQTAAPINKLRMAVNALIFKLPLQYEELENYRKPVEQPKIKWQLLLPSK